MDFEGAQCVFRANFREAYRAVDVSRPRRIASQLYNGGHTGTYGVQSTIDIVARETKRLGNAVIVRPSARVVKGQKVNDKFAIKQDCVGKSVEAADNAANVLHNMRRNIDALTSQLTYAKSASDRRKIKQAIHELKTGNVDVRRKNTPVYVQSYIDCASEFQPLIDYLHTHCF